MGELRLRAATTYCTLKWKLIINELEGKKETVRVRLKEIITS
jgi:hypothetical protein